MALTLTDRTKESTTTTGTGTVTLLGAATGFQSFATVGNANTTYYCIAGQSGSEWEVGIGTYTLSGTTLSRTTVLSSSNAGLLVNFSAGTKDVFVTYPSGKSVNLDASGNATAFGTPVAFVGTNITGTAASLTAGAVTDGVYTTGSYSNPAWITALANNKITGLGSAALLTAGSANGVATLDGGGTVPTAQLPAAVLGAIKYQGTWNATTNIPTLTSSVGTQGYYYVVATAGTTTLDGISSWEIGDWAIFGTATWQKIDNTDAVTSVNGFTGTVSIAYADLAGAIPTWNQNTTGNAATVTTNANLTGMITSVGNAASLGSFTSAQLATALTDETGSGANVFATSPTLITPALGTPTALVLTNATGLTVPGGGTGLATLTANNVILGAGTSSPTFVAPSTSGNYLTSNGTTWVSQTPAGGGVTTFSAGTTGLTPSTGTAGAVTLAGTLAVANGGTGVITSTGTGSVVLSTSPTLTTPIIVQSINAQTTAAYVTVASDAGAIVTVSNASANTFKLPTNASVAYAIGSTITLIQIGAGATTISAVTPGTTIVLSTGATPASPVLAQYRSATCIKTGADAWYIVGALA